MSAGEQKMSNIFELETKLIEQANKIDLDQLTKKSKEAEILLEGIVPIINEVILAAADKGNYEEAYKAIIDKLREVHERVSEKKRKAQFDLLTSAGKKSALSEIAEEVSLLAQAERDKVQKQRVDEIAERIQSGSYDPDTPRKIGERPESLKNIRAAKQTLFSQADPVSSDIEQDG